MRRAKRASKRFTRMVRRAVGTEVKHAMYDYYATLAGFGGGQYTQTELHNSSPLMYINNGLTQENRVGRKIEVTGAKLNLMLALNDNITWFKGLTISTPAPEVSGQVYYDVWVIQRKAGQDEALYTADIEAELYFDPKKPWLKGKMWNGQWMDVYESTDPSPQKGVSRFWVLKKVTFVFTKRSGDVWTYQLIDPSLKVQDTSQRSVSVLQRSMWLKMKKTRIEYPREASSTSSYQPPLKYDMFLVTKGYWLAGGATFLALSTAGPTLTWTWDISYVDA